MNCNYVMVLMLSNDNDLNTKTRPGRSMVELPGWMMFELVEGQVPSISGTI